MTTPAPSGAADRAPLPMPTARTVLYELYPDAACELDFTTAFELLVATVLSAQTTDVRVNQVTPALFGSYPTPEAMAEAEHAHVAQILHPLGMGARRAERVIRLSQQLLADHGGEVPDDQDALEALAGVGRKTAHVVRGNWFGQSLLTVDTHVGRLSARFGWSAKKSPLAIEKDVVAVAEAADGDTDLTLLSHQMILHGRRVCTARRPDCGACPLQEACPQVGVA
ncbi:endonuclease III [Helcobacillus massiliensis]|uniref:endonuclease III domain-containing protein n=1 Tax=Helcobacillus massiliensis TaxID=521392 RepID=UPI0021A263C5|nr:endonuclease III [Helcobacillus massiliensis]MCT1556629.1 endonuclease III [Helcobacillus massiliensis]MCT2035823.1 endonuclease III [Helcobacillus massiliensis]MCT2331095.1 endonuclease III [Helcobacillus massiliensis]